MYFTFGVRGTRRGVGFMKRNVVSTLGEMTHNSTEIVHRLEAVASHTHALKRGKRYDNTS